MTFATPLARQTDETELRREPITKSTGLLNPPVDPRPIETGTTDTTGLMFDVDVVFWKTIEDSTKAEDYEAYLQVFPEGIFASLARRRVMRLATMTEACEPTTKPVCQSGRLDFDRLSERAKENTERAKRNAAKLLRYS